MVWVSPTGFVDPAGQWTNETNIYDEDTDTYGQDSVYGPAWGDYVELTHAAISCDKVRFNAKYVDVSQNSIILDVYYEGAWHNIYEGSYTLNTWEEKTIPAGTKSVTAARAKFYNAYPLNFAMLFYEFDFWETVVLHEKVISEGIAVAEVLIKNPIKIVSEGVALGEVLRKMITKAPFVEGIAVGEVVQTVYIHVKEIIEGLAIGEAVTKMVNKVISEGIAIGEVLIKMRVIKAIRSLSAARVLDALRNLVSERTRPPE